MRKTTEELWKEAVDTTPESGDVHETFRRLVIENERECAEPATAWCAIDEGGAHLRWNKDDHHDWHPLFTFPPAAQVPEGWKLVPIKPTYEMLVATIAQQAAELKRINNVANCGTVDSWLSLSDEKKREWFAMTLHTDSEKAKTIKEQDYQLERQAEQLAAAETDAWRYRVIRSGELPIFCIEYVETDDYESRTLYDEDLDQSIDAAIAASREEKS